MKTMEFPGASPGVLVLSSLLVVVALVLAVFAWVMHAQALSLRPLAWFAAVFLAIVLPQVALHVCKSLAGGAGEAATGWWDQETRPPANDGDLLRWLGPATQGAMVSDFAPMLDAAGAPPRWARFVVCRDGRTVVIAAFDTPSAAQRGVTAWLALSGLAGHAHGSPATGYGSARPAGDRIFARALGVHMLVWSADDFSGLKALVAASSFPASVLDGMVPETGDAVIEPPPFGLSWPVAAAALLAYTGLVAVLFLKGAAWASALPPAATSAVDLQTLRSRLIDVGRGDVPFVVMPAPGNADEIVVEWRYADARWFDLMQAHALRRIHRLVLRLDASAGAVYVREFESAFDGSAGPGGARLRWEGSMGITFLQVVHQRVYGVQVDPDGRPSGALEYRWSFNLQEMKSPLQAVVSRSGWTWRPVLWDAPGPLGWFFR